MPRRWWLRAVPGTTLALATRLIADGRAPAQKPRPPAPATQPEEPGASRRVAPGLDWVDYGEFPLMPQDDRMADVQRRRGDLEKTIDLLQQDVGNLKRMIRAFKEAPDNVAAPPTFTPR
jgi:hypothetical protein